MNAQKIHKKTDSDQLSWSNLKKKIIKKYPQYKMIVDANSSTFSKLDFTKKENQVKVINMIIEKQQQALQLIFTEEIEQQKKETQKQMQKLVGNIAKKSHSNSQRLNDIKKKEQLKGNQKNKVIAPVKLEKKVSDKIEAWNTIDETQSFIHDYQDQTQERFYITQDVEAPLENSEIKSSNNQQKPQSILTKKKKKQKKSKTSQLKEKCVRFKDDSQENKKNIDQLEKQNVKKVIFNEQQENETEQEKQTLEHEQISEQEYPSSQDDEGHQIEEDNEEDNENNEESDNEEEEEEDEDKEEEEEEEEEDDEEQQNEESNDEENDRQDETEEDEEDDEEEDDEEEEEEEEDEENEENEEEENDDQEDEDNDNDVQEDQQIEEKENEKKLQRLKEKALKKKC